MENKNLVLFLPLVPIFKVWLSSLCSRKGSSFSSLWLITSLSSLNILTTVWINAQITQQLNRDLFPLLICFSSVLSDADPVLLHLKFLFLETSDYTCAPLFFKNDVQAQHMTKSSQISVQLCSLSSFCEGLTGLSHTWLQVPDSWCHLFIALAGGEWNLKIRWTKISCNSHFCSEHQHFVLCGEKKLLDV